MSLESWLLFCATETVLCLTPGPAVLLVVSTALGGRVGAGLRAALGVLAANLVYFAISATSLGALLATSWRVFLAVKWIGAAYLIWLGLNALLRPKRIDPEADRQAPAVRSFVHGFVTQGANPKALLFFTALLPQFIDPAGPVALQIGILGASSVLIELAVLAGYALAAAHARRRIRRPGFEPGLQRVGGLLLIGAGAGLAGLRRTAP